MIIKTILLCFLCCFYGSVQSVMYNYSRYVVMRGAMPSSNLIKKAGGLSVQKMPKKGHVIVRCVIRCSYDKTSSFDEVEENDDLN